jgi:purine-binding chemotaxis protein CheW
VYDVRPRLRLEVAPTHWPLPSTELRSLRVVLLRAPGGDAGILAEGVQGVVRLPMDALEAPPTAPLPMACVAGLGRRGEELYILLDIEAALG